MSQTQYTHGRVVWRELMTNDAAKARAFYGELFGWKFESHEMGPGMNYEVILLGDKQLGGFWQMGPQQDDPSTWMSYVSVPDVDAAAKIATDNGGQVVHGPSDIPNVGRCVVVVDFAGAMVVPFRDNQGDPPPEMPKLGEFCWETLSTSDEARARDFYGKLFGWTPMQSNGGGIPVFTRNGTPQGMVADLEKAKNFPPSWLTYVVVETIESACERATRLGGKVLVPRVEVPSVGRTAMIADPSGARLGLFQPNMR